MGQAPESCSAFLKGEEEAEERGAGRSRESSAEFTDSFIL